MFSLFVDTTDGNCMAGPRVVDCTRMRTTSVLFNDIDYDEATIVVLETHKCHSTLFLLSFFLYVQEYTGPGGAEVEVEKPVKEEFSVAKWIKSNVPTKKTKFLNHNVEYFTGEKSRLFSYIEIDFH